VTTEILRPKDSVIWQGLVATIAFLTPVFAVLYFMTAPHGPWPVVAATQAVATVLGSIAVFSFTAAAIWISPGVVAEREFFGKRTRFETADIGAVVLTHTFSPHGADPVPQLFLLDHKGNLLVRMRGRFWTRESMRLVIAATEVAATIRAEPVSISELRREHPRMLYYFERHPVVGALAFSVLVIAFGVLLLLAATLAGVV